MGRTYLRVERDRYRDAWSPEEDERLIALRMERRSIPACAVELGRSQNSVENRWVRLRKARALPRVRGVMADPVANFWARIDMSAGPDACWPFTGRARHLGGYGASYFDFGSGPTAQAAHRVALFIDQGFLTSGKLVMHACDNKICCNPAHLSEGTASENIRDAWARGLINPLRKRSDRPTAVLTEVQVAAIRRLRAGGAKREDIAIAAGVSISAIDHILQGRSWKAVA